MVKMLVVKIKEKGSKGPGCYQYKNEIVISDPHQLSILLFDLANMGAKIEKAFEEYNQKKDKWPFG